MVSAGDRQQARVVFRYVRGLLESVPMLAAKIERQTSEAIHLSNRVSIEVHTASYRTTRGYTVVGAVLDEVAYWSVEDSSNPDHEIVNAIRPAMATIPGALLLGISSPYARRGVLWDAYKRHHGKDGDPVLVWQSDTRSIESERRRGGDRSGLRLRPRTCDSPRRTDPREEDSHRLLDGPVGPRCPRPSENA